MKIRDLISGVLVTFKTVFSKDNPVKLGRLFTPEISELERDRVCEVRLQKLFNLLYCFASIACPIRIIIAYWPEGIVKSIELGFLLLIAFAFGGVIIQIIRPISRLKPGRPKSTKIHGDESAFKDVSILTRFDEVMSSFDDNSIDSNQAKAIVDSVYDAELHITGLSKPHFGDWLVDRYGTKICRGRKGRYSGKVILNAENSHVQSDKWRKIIEEIKKPLAIM